MDLRIKRGQILKELREQKKLRQSDLAKMLNITQQAYQRYEYGTSEPNADGFTMLADFYGVTVDYLLGREPAHNPFEDCGGSPEEWDAVQARLNNLPPETKAAMLGVLHQLAEETRAYQAGATPLENTMEDCGTVGEELEHRAREAELEAEALGKETA